MNTPLAPMPLRKAAVSLLLLVTTVTLQAQTLQWTSPLPVPAGYAATLEQSSLDGLGGSAWVVQCLNQENLDQLTRLVWLGRCGEILYTNDVPAVMGSSNQISVIRISPTELALTLTTFQNDVFPNVISQTLRRVERQGKTAVVRDVVLSSGEFMVGEANHTDRTGFFSVGQTNATSLVVRRYSNTYPPLR